MMRTAGMRTAAVSSRWYFKASFGTSPRECRRTRLDLRLLGARRRGLDHAAIPALALLELGDRLEEMPRAEVRPENGRDVDLRVGDLPEQIVRDAHLPAGADQEVRIRQSGRVEARGDGLLVDVLGF